MTCQGAPQSCPCNREAVLCAFLNGDRKVLCARCPDILRAAGMEVEIEPRGILRTWHRRFPTFTPVTVVPWWSDTPRDAPVEVPPEAQPAASPPDPVRAQPTVPEAGIVVSRSDAFAILQALPDPPGLSDGVCAAAHRAAGALFPRRC